MLFEGVGWGGGGQRWLGVLGCGCVWGGGGRGLSDGGGGVP